MARRAKVVRRFWTDDELAIVRDLYPDHRTEDVAKRLHRPIGSVYQKAEALGVSKSKAFLQSAASGVMYKGDPRKIGEAFRFKPGSVPYNKGLRRPGWAPGRMASTQFKKGQRSGKAAENWKPIGSISVDHEGYMRIKVREAKHGKEPTGFGNKLVWPLVHHRTWMHYHGKRRVPKHHAVIFKDGDRSNVGIDNLECVHRSVLASRNCMWHNLPRELAEAIQLTGAIKRQIRQREEKENGKK